MNNLLERLHASFFFYIMTGPVTFLKIGSYLPSAVIVSVAMMFAGLYEWVNAAWFRDNTVAGPNTDKVEGELTTEQPKWVRRRRPVLQVLGILIATHMFGVLFFLMITTSIFTRYQSVCSLSPTF